MAVVWRDSSALFRLSEKKYIDDMVRLTENYPIGFLQEPENMYKYTQYKSNELFPQTKYSSECKNYDVTVFSRYGEYFDCNPISTKFRTKFGRAKSDPDLTAIVDVVRPKNPTSVDTRISSGRASSEKNSLNGRRYSGKASSSPNLQSTIQEKDVNERNNPFQNEVWYRKSDMNDKRIRTLNEGDTADRLTILKRLTRETESSKQKQTTFQLSKRNDKTDSKVRKVRPKAMVVPKNTFVKRRINRYEIQDMVDRLSMCSPFKRYHQRMSEEVQ
ncbi:hypothetical protein LOTGIDRAFT_153271 [Lottia gigantea]|uniref:Uncharacterized protein n=1 Tax=Lottia gigantea TaxID=225164 RepID=V4AF61_LOTGI|nr:hypothetical protein LOTGIDRAFT_153271 [Lottia gigantea]ESO93800.1 hypothetical protein LOTGIDRAFT_153271 [Lottia gigantea]